MKSILEAFAKNRLYTITCDYQNTTEYEKISLKSYDIRKNLTITLNDEQKKLLDELFNVHKEMNHMSEIEQFVHGYQIGALMLAEAFSAVDDLIYEPEELELGSSET